MVGTICPMVHGARTKREGTKVLVMHAVGSLAGAGMMGGAVGAFGALVFGKFDRNRALGLGLTALLCLLYIVEELGFIRLPHPQSRLRVPASWRLRSRSWAAWLYGFALGVGAGTPILFNTFYIVIIWCIVMGDPITGAIVFLGFGIGRAFPIALLSGLKTTAEASSAMQSVCWNLSLIHFVNECALTFSATVLFFNSIG